MRVKGFFRDFKIGEFTADSGDICLWIASGFTCFRDYKARNFLYPMGWWMRWKLWRELKREIMRRAKEAVLERQIRNADAVLNEVRNFVEREADRCS